MDKKRRQSSETGKESIGSEQNGKSVRRREFSKKKMALFTLGVLLALILFFIFRNILFFLMELSELPDEKYPVQGVDVSAHQKEIDWKCLEDEGVKFAFIKATEGTTFIDKNFEYNWKEAHKTRMKVGAYHFLSYNSSGESQAQNYIDTVRKKWGMMPPVVDVEFYGDYSHHNISGDEMYAILDVVLEMLEEEYGKKPIIYTNRNIYKKYISGKYDEHPVWISCPDYIPGELSDGREWLFCQYTFTGTSPSISDGTVYVDYNVFNGSPWEFWRYNGK